MPGEPERLIRSAGDVWCRVSRRVNPGEPEVFWYRVAGRVNPERRRCLVPGEPEGLIRSAGGVWCRVSRRVNPERRRKDAVRNRRRVRQVQCSCSKRMQAFCDTARYSLTTALISLTRSGSMCIAAAMSRI